MSNATDRHRIVPEDTALLLVDFQERLAAVMPEAERQACEQNISLLLDLAQRQGWPVVVSEQYTKGLGPTVAALADLLAAQAPYRIEKLHFATTDAPEFPSVFSAIGKRRWVVVGMESHVCVFQTVRGLLDLGVQVFVPDDAVVSRAPSNRARGLAMMAGMGAVLTSTEAIVFDALHIAGTADFKAMSKRIR